MREYSIKDIKKISNLGILFYDNYYIDFTECTKEWANKHFISINETNCVAIRGIENNTRYFIFCSKEKVRIIFDFKGLFKKRRNKEKFTELQVNLNRLGYTSFDES